jgi:hypothetical protein
MPEFGHESTIQWNKRFKRDRKEKIRISHKDPPGLTANGEMGGFNRIYNLPELRKKHEVYRTYEVGWRGAEILKQAEVDRLAAIEEAIKEAAAMKLLQIEQKKKDDKAKDEVNFQQDVAAKHSFKELKEIRMKVENDILDAKRDRHNKVRSRLQKFAVADNVAAQKGKEKEAEEEQHERDELYQQFGNAAVKKRANDKTEKLNKLAKKSARAHQKAVEAALATQNMKTRLHIPESERLVRPKRAIQRKIEADEIRRRMKKEKIHLPACYARQQRRNNFNSFVRNEDDASGAETYAVKSAPKKIRVRRRDVKGLKVIEPVKKRHWFFRTLLGKGKQLPTLSRPLDEVSGSDSDGGDSDESSDDEGPRAGSSAADSPIGSAMRNGEPTSFVRKLKDRKVIPVQRLKDEYLKWDDPARKKDSKKKKDEKLRSIDDIFVPTSFQDIPEEKLAQGAKILNGLKSLVMGSGEARRDDASLKDELRKAKGLPIFSPVTLLDACLEGHFEMVKACLIEGVSAVSKDRDGRTGVHLAAKGGFHKICSILLSHRLGTPSSAKEKKLVNRTDTIPEQRWTALHEACLAGHEKVARVLVDHGAHVNHGDPKHHQTPLMFACLHNHIGIVKFLVGKCNCHLDAQDKEGKTALHIAATHADDDVVKLLIRCNADLMLVDHDHHTASQYARLAGRHVLSDAMRVRKKAIDRDQVLIAIESELYGLG